MVLRPSRRGVARSPPRARFRRCTPRADEGAGDRGRRRWLRQQAEEEAAFTGTLLALLERGTTAVLGTESGRRHQGRLVGVARDVCALRTAEGRTVWLRLDTVAMVRPEGGLEHAPAADPRGEREELEFADVLARLAEERVAVQLVTRGCPTVVAGELRAVGADVATVLEGDRRTACYVRLPSVVEVSLFGSG